MPLEGTIVVNGPAALVKVGVSPGTPGPAGAGFDYQGTVPTYSALSTSLGHDDAGKAWQVIADGKLYIWSGTAFPASGAGAVFKGDKGDTGNGVDSITTIAGGLRFGMTDSTNKDVTVPAIADAQTAASNAAASATAAAGSSSAAATSASAAAGSATSASSSAGSATTSASAAASSATNAAASETNAASSAASAGSSQTAAAGSASTASSSASAASSSASAAAGSASSASGSAGAASSSAAAASSSETNAATSASGAHDSELAAAQSAQDAADIVNSGIPNAGPTTKGGVQLPGAVDGELGGTWDHPAVTGWSKKADLVGGKVPSSQIPALATTETFVVANSAARLALSCETGDVAVQTADPGKGTYILQGSNPATAGDWVLMATPTDAVSSVNSKTGAVVLGKADVGLGNVDNTSDNSKPVSTATQAALDAKAAAARTITAGTGLTGGGDLTANRTLAADFGTTAGKVAQGNDSRFTDQRTPLDGSVTAAKLDPSLVLGDKEWSGTKTGTGTLTLAAGDLNKAWLIDGYNSVTLPTAGVADSSVVLLGAVGATGVPITNTLRVPGVGAPSMTGLSASSAATGGVVLVFDSATPTWDYYGRAVSPSDLLEGSVWPGHIVDGAVTAPKIGTTANQITKVGSTTSSATPSFDSSTYDSYHITALAAAMTSLTISNGSDGKKVIVRIRDNGTARALTFGSSFVGDLPTTTTVGKTLMLGMIYDSAASKWVCVAKAEY